VNYTSYVRGINGIMVDFSDLPAVPTVDDFEFKVGNDNDPTGWAGAPEPVEIALREDVDVDNDGTPDAELHLPKLPWLDSSDFSGGQGRPSKIAAPALAAVEKLLATL